MHKILVTGAGGQLGSDLVTALRCQYGMSNVIESGWRTPPYNVNLSTYAVLDVTDYASLEALIQRYQINTIYHLAGVLSAKGEQQPRSSWEKTPEVCTFSRLLKRCVTR